MKKLIVFAIVALLAASLFAQTAAPYNKKCTFEEATARKAELEAGGLKDNVAYRQEYAYMCVIVDLKGKEPDSYADLAALATDPFRQAAVWQYAMWRNNKFAPEAIRDIIKNGNGSMIVSVLSYEKLRKAGGLSLDDACVVMMDKVKTDDIRSLDKLIDMLADCTLDEETLKTYLKKVNRACSKELLGPNKAKYEPVIAKIRTLLATF